MLAAGGYVADRALAIEPGVNKLAARGWRRGRATLSILLGVLFAFLVFVVAVSASVPGHCAVEKLTCQLIELLRGQFASTASMSAGRGKLGRRLAVAQLDFQALCVACICSIDQDVVMGR